MDSDDHHSFVPILVSLSLFSFLAKSVKLNGLHLFLVVVFVVYRPEMYVTWPNDGGVIQIFCIYYRHVKNKILFLYFLYLSYAIDLYSVINVKVLSFKISNKENNQSGFFFDRLAKHFLHPIATFRIFQAERVF